MDKLIDEIIKSLEEVKNKPYITSMDVGDLGNEIGIVLGKHLSVIKGGKDGS